MSLKEIQERHEIVEDQLKVWGGNPEPVDGTEAHQDRKELIRRVKKLEAQIAERNLDLYTANRKAEELEAELAKKIQHLKDADCCGDIAVKRYQKAEARLERVLDAEIPWEYGMMKLRHTAVVKAALEEGG